MAEPSRKSYVKKAAALTTEHKDRRMKSYLILDIELRQISTLNGWATLFVSAGSCLWSLAFGLWSGLFIESDPSPGAREYGWALEAIFFLLGLGCFALVGKAMRDRACDIRRIKDESGDTPEVER